MQFPQGHVTAGEPGAPRSAAGALASRCGRAGYVLVGLGVLAVQKAQARRRELGLAEGQDLEAGVDRILHDLDERLEPLVARLPEPVRGVVLHAREARDDLRRRAFGPEP